nr:cytochrome P450 [uncultured Actinomyces sp.]
MSDTTRRSARRICACDAAYSQDSTQARAPATDPAGRPAVRSHTEAVAVASDATLFSSRVSRFLQVPNGLDGEEHRMMRGLLAPFFFPAALKELQPRLEKTAARLIETRRPERALCAVHELGSLYAVRAQSTWLGWCPEIEDELVEWVEANHEATRSGALERTREVARWFDRIMRDLIAQRRQTDVAHDVTWRLTRLRRLNGTPVSDDEIVSILRNWTGGDLSSLALCTGVLLHWLIEHPEHQAAWPSLDDTALDRAIDEVLRIDDPFTFSRRLVTAPTTLAGRPVAAGVHVVIDWTSANRDPDVFDDPDVYNPAGNAERNLVYGTGPHACPGRPLATLELRVLLRALLARFTVSAAPCGRAQRAEWPLGGWERVPIVLNERRP